MTITKQRVGKIIYRHEMGLNSDVTAEEVYDLAVLALNLSNIANLSTHASISWSASDTIASSR